jgi:hypothetical protein
MGDLSRIDDADLYLETVGSTCVECGRQDSKARLFMPPHPMHIGNIVVLCDHCEKTYRPMSIDVFARVAMNKYELEEKIFGARLPVETDRQLELRRARRDAERIYAARHPEIDLTDSDVSVSQ